MNDMLSDYRALRFRTEAERLRAAAAELHSTVMRGLVMRLADDYDMLAVRAAKPDGTFCHSNDD